MRVRSLVRGQKHPTYTYMPANSGVDIGVVEQAEGRFLNQLYAFRLEIQNWTIRVSVQW